MDGLMTQNIVIASRFSRPSQANSHRIGLGDDPLPTLDKNVTKKKIILIG